MGICPRLHNELSTTRITWDLLDSSDCAHSPERTIEGAPVVGRLESGDIEICRRARRISNPQALRDGGILPKSAEISWLVHDLEHQECRWLVRQRHDPIAGRFETDFGLLREALDASKSVSGTVPARYQTLSVSATQPAPRSQVFLLGSIALVDAVRCRPYRASLWRRRWDELRVAVKRLRVRGRPHQVHGQLPLTLCIDSADEVKLSNPSLESPRVTQILRY